VTCRTCKYLDVAPDKSGRIVPRKGNSYRCLAPHPTLPPLPDCITRRYDFQPFFVRSWMSPPDGGECPVYEAR
jgi:hypothetical protein